MNSLYDDEEMEYVFHKGDLVHYVYETFYMSSHSGFVLDHREEMGIIISEIVHTTPYNPSGGFFSLGDPLFHRDDVPYYRIYSIEKREIFYISCDKIQIIKNKE
jgi:hypothetical protein